MTIVTRTNVPAATSTFLRGSVPAPAVVWDLPARSRGTGGAGVVRSLGAAARTPERSNIGAGLPCPDVPDPVEARHESRASLIMGAALGLALLVGSAVGGVFSDAATATHGAGDSTREVVAAVQ